MIRRVITGVLIGAAWALMLLYLPGQVLFPILVLFAILCQWEFYRMLSQSGKHVCTGLGIAWGVLWMILGFVFPFGATELAVTARQIELALMFLMGFSLLVLLMFDKLGRQPLQAASLTLLGFFYIPFMLSFYLRLAQWGVKDPFCFSNEGIFLAFYMSAIVKLGDVGAFGVGMACGRHKMIPRISPAKSWEGLAGGLSSSVLASILILIALRIFPAIPAGPLSGMPLWLGAVIGLALGIVGTLGDLVESMFKRELSAKDSSRIFPGMGGVLDVFDSLIFTPALFYLILVCYVK